jgi:xanthine/uracil/vitamin C permease (AzgA family)
VVTATALSSMVACLLTGLCANLPVGVSPGMGLNAYLVFSQVLGLGVSPERALAGCFTAACLVAALALARALAAILGVVPNSIKLAVVGCAVGVLKWGPGGTAGGRGGRGGNWSSWGAAATMGWRCPAISAAPSFAPAPPWPPQVVGMGLLLSFIGLQTSRIVVADPETMVTMGGLLQPEPLLAVGGLALIAALHHRNVRGSILLGVLATALGYWTINSSWPTR